MNFKNRKLFSLVELIIVIAIIGVLSVSAFTIVTKWLGKSRDSRRLGEINQIAKGLQSYFVENGKYPTPDMNYITLTSGSNTIGYQGYIGSGVSRAIELNKITKDPMDEKYYTYTTNLSKYQLMAMMEGSGSMNLVYGGKEQGERINEYVINVIAREGNDRGDPKIASQELISENGSQGQLIFNSLYAVDYSQRYPYLVGDKLGVILANTGGNTNAPVQELYNSTTFTGINVPTINTGIYTSYVDNTTILNGTGLLQMPIYTNESVVTPTIQPSNTNCNSTTYSGYIITTLNHGQSQSFTKTGSTVNGVRTYTLPTTCNNGILTYGIETTSVTCNSGYVEGVGYTCVADVCAGTIADVNGSSTATSQTSSQSWHRSATAGVCTRSCNGGYSWNGSSCALSQQNPSGLTLTHTNNRKTFVISFSGGVLNGNCKIEYQLGGSNTWTLVSSPSSLDCDTNNSNVNITLGNSPWTASGQSKSVRIVRISDSQVIGTFGTTLNCTSLAGSSSSTSSIDENCNGNWDDSVSQGGIWPGGGSSACGDSGPPGSPIGSVGGSCSPGSQGILIGGTIYPSYGGNCAGGEGWGAGYLVTCSSLGSLYY